MALSYEQFMKASGAELVAGNIIVGIMGERKKVGSLGDDGVFNLNDEVSPFLVFPILLKIR